MKYPLSAASLGLTALAALAPAVYGAKTDKPNVVMVLVDDQDAFMNSIDHMPNVTNHIVKKGTTFEKHYCTTSICCPSRVNIWTGQLSHNTNVTNVNPPYGGWPKFVENKYLDHHLALWMQQESDYNTYYVGKLFNAHNTTNYNEPKAMTGYTGSEFWLEPNTYQYFNVGSTRNGNKPHYPKGYTTDLVSEYGIEFLDDALEDPDKPFFLTLAPVAPHYDLTMGDEKKSTPPQPAPRHADMFKDYKIPRTKNFNPDKPSSVSWIKKLEKLNDGQVQKNDEVQIKRLQALQAVDDMVGAVVDKLDKEGILDNTYIIYTSDNGYHISQHRMPPGKTCGLETDINVPFVIRGPGIKEGGKRTDPTSHVDIAPSIMKLAGNTVDDKKFDGAAIDFTKAPTSGKTEHVNIEFWGMAPQKGSNGETDFNTYKGIRLEADDYAFYYSVWCTNESELYDMKDDEEQLNNLLADGAEKSDNLLQAASTDQVTDRLDALLMVLKSCKEDSCRDPWKTLHPDGSVKNLSDALDKKYNDFYKKQVKIKFDSCNRGYVIQVEGPQSDELDVFGEDSGKMTIDPRWHWWE